MRKGEKVFFGIAALLTVAALYRVAGPAGEGTPKPPRDYTLWTETAQEGYRLYKSKGCNSCHRVLRMGEIGVAPVLDGEGTRRSEQWLTDYFTDPARLVEGTAHDGSLGPDFRRLGTEERKLLTAFMYSLRSNPGSSNYPVPPQDDGPAGPDNETEQEGQR
ncbi:MAG TPA: cytochrome c [Gammaproteobacteria bacterium]|nr:cytochrome c [Gammaproteobacteria bacterium]